MTTLHASNGGLAHTLMYNAPIYFAFGTVIFDRDTALNDKVLIHVMAVKLSTLVNGTVSNDRVLIVAIPGGTTNEVINGKAMKVKLELVLVNIQ
jgi:hypothetical protein